MNKSKVFSIIKKVINILVVVLLAAFVIVVCLQRFSENKISFFNYRMFTVISGSMKPKYDIGDVLISKKVDASTIKVGDTITYNGVSGDFKGKVITHQVIAINKDSHGKYIFRTRGLANLVEDPIVSEKDILGLVIYRSVILSNIYRIVSTKIGFYLFIILPLLYVIGSEMVSALLNKEEKRREKLNGSL